MCGIVGVYITSPEGHKHHKYMKRHFSKLLVAAQVRGTHASGAFVLRNGKAWYTRSAVPASKLIKTYAYKDALAHVGKRTTAMVGHTRYATTGSPSIDANNHPIWDKPIIGVHNGVLVNHKALDAKYGSTAEVDSAAAIAAIRHQVEDGSAMTTRKVADACSEVSGVYTFVVADVRTGEVWTARNTNPLVFFDDAAHGLLWFASTESIMRESLPEATFTEQPPYSVRQLLPTGLRDVEAIAQKATQTYRHDGYDQPELFLSEQGDGYSVWKQRIAEWDEEGEEEEYRDVRYVSH